MTEATTHKPARAGDEAEWAYEAAYAELPQDSRIRLQGSPLDWTADEWQFTREYGSIGSGVDRECDAALAFLAIARVTTMRVALDVMHDPERGCIACDRAPVSLDELGGEDIDWSRYTTAAMQ